MKESSLSKSSKQKSESNKDWGTKPQASHHHTPPKWESPIKPTDVPVDISTLETVQLGDTTFYVLYSRVVPPLSETEFEGLCSDVAEKKEVLIAIIVDERNIIIDGEHRARAAQKVGLKQIPVQVRPGLSEPEKWKMGQDLNLHRRHLTPEQIQQIIKENRGKLPQMALELRQEGKSLRTIGDELGVSHQQAKKLIQTEAAVNKITVELPKTIKGKDGKKHPAKKALINVNTTKELQRALDACKIIGAENLPSKPLELKRVERIAKESERARLREQDVHDFKLGQAKLLVGDFRERCSEIEDSSVDLCFTDPLYSKDALPTWGDLGQMCAKKLKPGGLLMAYSGVLYLPQIHQMLGEHLDYLWMAAIYHSGHSKLVRAVKIHQAWKPVLIYYKPPLRKYWHPFYDMVSGGQGKEHHMYEQSVGEAMHYIQAACPAKGVLLDPMFGSGTSILAGLEANLGLTCIGCEVDKAAYADAETRVKETIEKLQAEKESA
jgi:ParB-like chromosome segregation protein Spo0J